MYTTKMREYLFLDRRMRRLEATSCGAHIYTWTEEEVQYMTEGLSGSGVTICI